MSKKQATDTAKDDLPVIHAYRRGDISQDNPILAIAIICVIFGLVLSVGGFGIDSTAMSAFGVIVLLAGVVVMAWGE